MGQAKRRKEAETYPKVDAFRPTAALAAGQVARPGHNTCHGTGIIGHDKDGAPIHCPCTASRMRARLNEAAKVADEKAKVETK